VVKALCCNREVTGSRPDEVDFSNLPNPSGRTMALGSTQPLTEMNLYIHSPMYLHAGVLNELSTEAILPFTLLRDGAGLA
jgi:hypothetical protein